MKLLSKREIDKAKAVDRQREIEQGVKLATRVDTLRETASEEEANLTKVRVASVAQLHAEINPLMDQKEQLISDIRELENLKRIAQIPLDAEWEKVRKEKESLNGLEERLSHREHSLAERSQQVEAGEKELAIEKERAAEYTHLAAQDRASASNSLDAAHESAAEMRNQAQIVLSNAELKETAALRREAKVAVREREVKMKDEYLTKRELDLIATERLLRDREQVLERNLKRYDFNSGSIPSGRE